MLFGNPVRQAVIRPAGSPSVAGDFRVTQDFGPTTVPQEPKVVWPGGEGIPAGTYAHFHRGIDISDARCGAAVVAAQAGVVIAAGKDGNGAIRVIVDHGQGFGSRYWHLADEIVSVGQSITKGQGIGHIGSTGNSTACHLHFGVTKHGGYVDPWLRLEQNTTTDPDAPEDDMPAITTNLTGQLATVGNMFGNVNVRDGVTSDANVTRQIAKGTTETWAVVGWVTGWNTAGSDQWLARLNGTIWEYVHKINVISVAPAPPPIVPTPLGPGIYEVR